MENVSANRCYHPKNFGAVVVRNEIHAFSDASKEAVGVAAYLKQLNQKGEVSVSLVFGQAKVAPIRPTSIPRLELCAAVLSTKAVKKLRTELDLKIDNVKFYTDSKVVLGYITKDACRFRVYVANRVQIISDTTKPQQSNYVDTSTNPAELATHKRPENKQRLRNLDDGQSVENEHRHPTSKDSNESAKIAIIKAVQNEVFANDISVLKRVNKETENRDQLKEQRRTLLKSNLAELDPFLDQDGVL
ncbi:tubulin polyglutamylase TTLL1 [Paramuricea clavata]|uniref:Tubulin polyglutamylase TTLL1 n=1 Tax=Paramuricea clavata TaxID=317549 RepID=A0A7D9HV32_PARCT|nr:tubulin polyglutamylase TTLL1 [Paramuricea clavata]